MNSKIESRMPWADLVRFVALAGIIFIHTSAPVFYAKEILSLKSFLAGTWIDSFARVGVPLFILLSGALLLKPTSQEFQFNRIIKPIKKVLIPLMFWSVICGFWMDYWLARPFNPIPHLIDLWGKPLMYHLDFCYYMLGIYIVLPVLDILAHHISGNTKFAIYFFTVWFICNCLVHYTPVPFLDRLQISGFLNWGAVFLLGFYVSQPNFLKAINPIYFGLTYLIASLITFGLTVYFSWDGLPKETAFKYLTPNVVIASVSLFIFLQRITIPRILHKPLASIAGVTFLIYFVHIFIMEFLKSGVFGFELVSFTKNVIFGTFATSILTFMISYITARIIRLVPGSSAIVG